MPHLPNEGFFIWIPTPIVATKNVSRVAHPSRFWKCGAFDSDLHFHELTSRSPLAARDPHPSRKARSMGHPEKQRPIQSPCHSP